MDNIQIITVAIDAIVPEANGKNPMKEMVTMNLESDFILLFVN